MILDLLAVLTGEGFCAEMEILLSFVLCDEKLANLEWCS